MNKGKLARLACAGIFLLSLLTDTTASANDNTALGTALLSPEEREALVNERNAPKVVKQEDTKPKTYTLTGIITRGNKKSVAWLNGQPVTQSPQSKDLPPISFHRDRVAIDGKPVKVGEILDIGSGQRFSPLPSGAVKVRVKR